MSKNIKSILLLSIFFIIFAGCSKKEPLPVSAQASQNSSFSEYQQSLIQPETPVSKSPNDPSVCKNNPNGYLFIKIGDELFRTTKDSFFYIQFVTPDHMRKHKKTDTDIPEGCKGNPYIYPDAKLSYRYKGDEPSWQKMVFGPFGVFEVDKNSSKDPFILSTVVDEFEQIKKHSNTCDKTEDFSEKCVYVGADKSYPPPVGYRSERHMVSGKPFTMVCSNYVATQRCTAAYKLYPTVGFSYEFDLIRNPHWNEHHIILVDEFLHNQIESIHVKE